MIANSVDAIWNLNQKELIELLESGTHQPKTSRICFYAPSFTYYKTSYYCSSPTAFPTISVTGSTCALNCRHCGGKVLETMNPALSGIELFDLCQKLKKEGAKGCLISGGCLSDGSVPIDDFISVLGRVKRELGLTVFVHTGILKVHTAKLLKEAGVDAALLDVIGSADTIKKVFNLKITPKDYLDSLKALDRSGINFVPHVIVGLNDGKLNGELEALKMISQVEPSALVIIAFMPIHGTIMEKTPAPKPIDIAKVALTARVMFPKTPLILGCMRPKGALRAKTDVLALKAGVDAIAFPSEEAVEYAKNHGYELSFSSYCCAQMYLDAKQNEK